jgi:hypothetical protein
MQPTTPAVETLRVEILPLPGSKVSGVVLQYGVDLIVFRLNPTAAEPEVEWLAWNTEVDRFELDRDAVELHTFATKDSWSWQEYWKVYRWQANQDAFRPVDPIGRLIFEQERYDDAIHALEAELQQLDLEDYEYAPKAGMLRYLIALCYELSGSPDVAAEAYLQIWREFPGTPYAHIAKAKLVSGNAE